MLLHPFSFILSFFSRLFFSLPWTESAVDRRVEFGRKRLKSYFHSGNWAGESKSSCPFADDDTWQDECVAGCCGTGERSEAVCIGPDGRVSVFCLSFSFLFRDCLQRHQRHSPQRHRHRQSNTRNRQQSRPAHSNDGPISFSSGLRNPFSPVPTNEITRPRAVAPSPA